MVKAVIIDDEQHCIDRLSEILLQYFSDKINLVGTAQSVQAGKDLINKYQPDLVFLDIQIVNETGFDLLNSYTNPHFSVIFTTAYEKYAVKAIKFSAIDYLLKPIDIDDLQIGIDKFINAFSQKDFKKKFDLLYANFKQLGIQERKIAVPTLSGIEFIPISSIVRCESNINYTAIHLNNKAKLVVAKTLKDFEEFLIEWNFFRVHNSHLINLSYIKSYNKGKGGSVFLTDGTEVEVSTRRKDAFIEKISTINLGNH